MRLVSIIGDSISTYEGYNPSGYAVFYDQEMCVRNGLKSVYDTWWAKVNQFLHAYLCVNNSYSGSKVSGKIFPSAESIERLSNLRTNQYIPNIILVYAGFNDFGYMIKTYKTRKWFRKDKAESFEEAYDHMLKTVRSMYPEAVIICATLMRTRMRNNDSWVFPEYYRGVVFEEYNDVIRKISQKNHCLLADLSKSGERYETLDGTHPTANGHATIANAWIRCFCESDLQNRLPGCK